MVSQLLNEIKDQWRGIVIDEMKLMKVLNIFFVKNVEGNKNLFYYVFCFSVMSRFFGVITARKNEVGGK